MKKLEKAFTLVELIVVITILTILGTIAFISFQGYSKEARDSKRITDTRGLIGKINIEHARGTNLSDLITSQTGYTLKINSQSGEVIRGIPNFTNLKENPENFKDPLNKSIDYPVAYAVGGSGSGSYEFIQILIESESSNKYRLFGNYYEMQPGDAKSLFLSGSTEIIDGLTELPYNPGIKEDTTVPKIFSCKWDGEEIFNVEINNNTDLKQDTSYQNIDDTGKCFFKCEMGYDFLINKCVKTFAVSDCNNFGDVLNTNTRYGNCDSFDLIVCSGNGTGNIISGCNIGTNISGTGNNSYGAHFQWGNNYPFPNNETIKKELTFFTEANSYGPSPLNYYYSDTFIYTDGDSTVRNDWAKPENNNLWGNTTNTNEARKGPCEEGYHVPTAEEWTKVSSFWKNTGDGNNMSSLLKIPFSGYRSRMSGGLTPLNTRGLYWSSSLDKSYLDPNLLDISSNSINSLYYNYRSLGASIRCFKN